MSINITQTILAGLLASVVYFIGGGILYMNPFVGKIYKSFAGAPGLKKWENTKKYLAYMHGIVFIQCFIFAFVYAFIKPAFTDIVVLNGFYFGLILIAVRIIPRMLDMWIQSTYPNKLLIIELINGTIASFVIAFAIVLVI